MKRYNIIPEKKEFSWGEMLVISLGEKGRGRYQEFVPYHAPEDAEYLEISKTKSGKPKIIEGKEPGKAWLAMLSGEGTYTRRTLGTVYTTNANVKVVASGYGAWGAAGRTGTWYEFLAVVPDGTFIKVRPAGGPHKIERYWLYFSEEKVYRVEKPEMDMFCEEYGLEHPPEEFERLKDLRSLR